MLQRQRLAPLGLLPSSSSSSSLRWLWSIPSHRLHPLHLLLPLPGLWSMQVLQQAPLHHKEGRLEEATTIACLWTLRWITLMVKLNLFRCLCIYLKHFLNFVIIKLLSFLHRYSIAEGGLKHAAAFGLTQNNQLCD